MERTRSSGVAGRDEAPDPVVPTQREKSVRQQSPPARWRPSSRFAVAPRRFGRGAVIAGVAGMCAVALPASGAEGSPAPTAYAPAETIEDQVAAADDEVQNASAEVAEIQRQLAAAEGELAAAQQALTTATTTASTSREAANRAQAALDEATAAVARVEAEIADLKAQLAALKGRIASMARTIYMSGGQVEELRIVLDSQDPAQIAERLVILKRLSRVNTELFDELAQAKLAMVAKSQEARQFRDVAEASKAETAMQLSKAVAAEQEALTAQTQVSEVVARKQTLLQSAASHHASVKQLYDQLLAEQQAIAAAAKAQAAKEAKEAKAQAARDKAAAAAAAAAAANKGKPGGRPGKTKPPAPAPSPTQAPTAPSGPSGGSAPSSGLSWPTPGHSAGGRTGWRIHPIYGDRSCHTGDDIGAGSGTPIRSAANGTVISTQSGGPYGNYTMISHGGGLVTMYAHQSRFAVKPGQKVSQGQVIGYVGSTGWSTGPHLHFEVHVNGVPYEPMGWFGESKHPVVCWSG